VCDEPIISKGIRSGAPTTPIGAWCPANRPCGAAWARNFSAFTKCDSAADRDSRLRALHRCHNSNRITRRRFEHEGDDVKISREDAVHCMQRGLSHRRGGPGVNGVVREVAAAVADEIRRRCQKLISISLEGSVG